MGASIKGVKAVGRPKKVVSEIDSDLRGLEALEMTVAEVIQETICSIPGCQPKFHLEDAKIILHKMQKLKLIKE